MTTMTTTYANNGSDNTVIAPPTRPKIGKCQWHSHSSLYQYPKEHSLTELNLQTLGHKAQNPKQERLLGHQK